MDYKRIQRETKSNPCGFNYEEKERQNQNWGLGVEAPEMSNFKSTLLQAHQCSQAQWFTSEILTGLKNPKFFYCCDNLTSFASADFFCLRNIVSIPPFIIFHSFILPLISILPLSHKNKWHLVYSWCWNKEISFPMHSFFSRHYIWRGGGSRLESSKAAVNLKSTTKQSKGVGRRPSPPHQSMNCRLWCQFLDYWAVSFLHSISRESWRCSFSDHSDFGALHNWLPSSISSVAMHISPLLMCTRALVKLFLKKYPSWWNYMDDCIVFHFAAQIWCLMKPSFN